MLMASKHPWLFRGNQLDNKVKVNLILRKVDAEFMEDYERIRKQMQKLQEVFIQYRRVESYIQQMTEFPTADQLRAVRITLIRLKKIVKDIEEDSVKVTEFLALIRADIKNIDKLVSTLKIESRKDLASNDNRNYVRRAA